MALTALPVLRDLVLRALARLGGAARFPDLIAAIDNMPDFVPTEDDLELDEKDRRAWHRRVRTALDQLYKADWVQLRGEVWELTPLGRVGAHRARVTADPPSQVESTPQVDPPPAAAPPPVPFQPSVIAQPLRDAAARAEVLGRRVADDDPMPVMIELNVSYAGGTAWAYEALRNLFLRLALIETAEAMPAAIDEYVPVRLSFARIQDLVAFDLEIADPKRVIHRVWPNFAVHGQMDVSCRTVKADAVRRSFNARGNGIVWAVIDSGIDATHPHFAAGNTLRAPEVADLHRDFTLSTTPDAVTAESALCDGDSRQGHGTAVASIIAGYLPADYAAGQLSVTATELGVDDRVISTPRQVAPSELCGMAPEALLVSLKVFSDDGDDSNTDRVMAALRYVMEVNARHETRPRIHGVNLSLGYRFDPEWFACGQSPLCRYVDRLVRSGVTVVVAAGNTGYASFTTQFAGRRSGGLPMSINDPGNAERAITVGATHRSAPHTYGVSYFSSKGPTGDGRRKPDLVAPGERVTAATAITAPVAQRDATYAEFSGTSFAAPHVSGVIAAFLSVRPEFVSQPEKVKQILMAAATPLGREPHFEGAGLVDAMRALQSV